MNFNELEAIEGLRWSWHSWPTTKPEAASLTILLPVMGTPLTEFLELPILSYEPLTCFKCGTILYPYARVYYTYRIWFCHFCFFKNPFLGTYSSLGESNLPAELFSNYSSVEYAKTVNSVSNPIGSSLSSSSLSSTSPKTTALAAEVGVRGPVFVFVIDGCLEEDELRGVKSELLRVVELLPETALVGLVTFDAMVNIYDLGFSECSRVVVFHGDRELSSEQIQNFLGIGGTKLQQLGNSTVIQKQIFLLPISECEFNITSAIEELHSSVQVTPGIGLKDQLGLDFWKDVWLTQGLGS